MRPVTAFLGRNVRTEGGNRSARKKIVRKIQIRLRGKNLGPNDKTALKRVRSPAETALLNFGRYRVTTIRNNFNRPRILIFRAKLHTSEFVSTPSCATMKQTGGCFREESPKPLTIQRFQAVQCFPFQQKRQKSRSVFSGFQAGGPALQHGRLFQGRKPEAAQLSGFKICNYLLQQSAQKDRSF